MDPELRDLICRTWRLLEQLGADREMCLRCTLRVVMQARPEMSQEEAEAAVRFVKHKKIAG